MTILAFDFGEKRIGVALGDEVIKIAHPLLTIATESNDIRFSQIAALIKAWQPTLLIVGLPSYLNGQEHEFSQQCRRFARRLHGRFNLPVGMWDERLTSYAAHDALNEIGLRGRNQKPVLDQVAAQQILQSYLEADNTNLLITI
jgi:putative Holliday junction resolvase